MLTCRGCRPDSCRERGESAKFDSSAARITVQGARYPEQLERMTGR